MTGNSLGSQQSNRQLWQAAAWVHNKAIDTVSEIIQLAVSYMPKKYNSGFIWKHRANRMLLGWSKQGDGQDMLDVWEIRKMHTVFLVGKRPGNEQIWWLDLYRRILEWLLNRRERECTSFIWHSVGSVMGCCECGYETSGYIRCGEFLDLLSNCQRVTSGSPWNTVYSTAFNGTWFWWGYYYYYYYYYWWVT